MKLTKSSRINLALYQLKIFSFGDLLFYLPRRYENFTPTKEDIVKKDKERVVIVGHLASTPVLTNFKKNASLIKFTFISKSMNIYYVHAWNRPFLSKTLNTSDDFTLVASYDKKKDIYNLLNIFKGELKEEQYIRPVYSLPKSLEQHEFIRLMNKAFKEVKKEYVKDIVPAYYKTKYKLIDKYDALYKAHFPKNKDDIALSHRHLKYEEALLFSLKMLLIKEANTSIIKENKTQIDFLKTNKFIGDLQFNLTIDQQNAVEEIIKDMNLERAMYRLLQGDVGSGKTLVVAIALFANYTRGNIGAFMAPTEALAKQHYEYLKKLYENIDIKVALLLGSTPTKERSLIRKALMNEEVDVIVGTHALFSKDISYSSLGLVVIDEQHKFGVNQRHLLSSKGENADLLMLSATPIPRSLALTLYGDLDVSTLLSFPFEGKDIETKIVSSKDKIIEELISNSLKNKGRVYIIAPRIELDDDSTSTLSLFEKYKKRYPLLVGLLHGRLSEDDKNFALKDFKDGFHPILVSTSVVEVGIDIKEADLMIVYEPQSFGLASLHQLRGRIGRNGQKSHFLLVYDDNLNEDIEKLNILVKSNDGFYIAEEDLKRRGPGELGGLKQSGLLDFAYLNIINDYKMFVIAKEDAKFILKNREQVGFARILRLANKEIEGEDFYTS